MKIQLSLKGFLQAITLSICVPALGAESSMQDPVSYKHEGEFRTTIEGDFRIANMEGNVEVTQGSLIVKGAEARFEYTLDTEELVRVTVQGSPANYQQNLEEDGETVTGNSETIVIFADELTGETVVDMIGNAYIESPDSTMRCAKILYQTEQNLVRGTGPCQGALSSSSN